MTRRKVPRRKWSWGAEGVKAEDEGRKVESKGVVFYFSLPPNDLQSIVRNEMEYIK